MIRLYHWIIYPTDFCFLLFLLVIGVQLIRHRASPKLQATWMHLVRQPIVAASLIFFLAYLLLATLDCFHFEADNRVSSLLDRLMSPLADFYEETYSSPLAIKSFSKSILFDEATSKAIQVYEPLQYVQVNTPQERNSELAKLILKGSYQGFAIWLTMVLLGVLVFLFRSNKPLSKLKTYLDRSLYPWKTVLGSLGILLLLINISAAVMPHYHLLGTDKVGQDIFYQAVKSIRTAFIIGCLTTFILLPLAVSLGLAAGYFGKRTDDIIQYTYTVISSIPGVLLIAASFLALQLIMYRHQDLFPSALQRAEFKLFMLCCILGMTSWTSLCRLIRAETLKLREIDFVQAAKAMGSNHYVILFKHILPNTMHIIIIATALDFSGLVLAEAVLSYVGIGVDPQLQSWGLMINAARLELARDPAVWWPLLTAFAFMLTLVLSANLVADALRDALDPKING